VHVEAHVLGGGVTERGAELEAFDAYLNGEMSEADAPSFEEELFAAAAAGSAPEADFVDHVSRLGSFLLPRGGFDVGSSRARVDELIAAGLRVQMLAPGPEGRVGDVFHLPRIDDQADIVVTHLPIDLRGYDSVNVIVEKPDGTELKTFRDVGWDPHDGSVYAVCEAPLARIAAAAGQIRARVIGKRDGVEQAIGVFETVSS
jgi:hypothetical protein